MSDEPVMSPAQIEVMLLNRPLKRQVLSDVHSRYEDVAKIQHDHTLAWCINKLKRVQTDGVGEGIKRRLIAELEKL